jgi:CheY-like chemotaxis protein
MVRILVADDAAMLRVLVCRSLGDHQVFQATDGDEALVLAQEHRPDIVILDWEMPGLDGIAVSRAIRDDPDLAGIQIVMITARNGLDSRERARAAGVDHFIHKPLMPRQISNLVEKILVSEGRARS